MKILLGTTSKGKIREYKAYFDHIQNIELVGLSDIGIELDAPETHDTFVENAKEKASFYNNIAGMPCIADDSGLMVDALAGSPGIYSARWTGEHANDATNCAKLVSELERLNVTQSKAQYVTACCLALNNNRYIETIGVLNGTVKTIPKGTNGFSYDPYFYLNNGKTIAELSTEEKNAIGNRGIAIKQLVNKLSDIL